MTSPLTDVVPCATHGQLEGAAVGVPDGEPLLLRVLDCVASLLRVPVGVIVGVGVLLPVWLELAVPVRLGDTDPVPDAVEEVVPLAEAVSEELLVTDPLPVPV